MTIWGDFMRRPEFKDKERYVCVVAGTERFKLASPIYKQNLYSGVFEDLEPSVTPLDFFNIDKKAFPLARDVNFMTVDVKPG